MADYEGVFSPVSSYLRTDHKAWQTIGTITASQTTLASDARDNTSVDALSSTKTIIWPVPRDYNGIEYRFITDADGDSHVVEKWVARRVVDSNGMLIARYDYTRKVILTLTGGTQAAPGLQVFVDTISKSNEKFNKSWKIIDGGGDNRMSIYWGDGCGYSRVLWIATTLQSGTTLTIQAAGF
jgi:hypothetical protein